MILLLCGFVALAGIFGMMEECAFLEIEWQTENFEELLGKNPNFIHIIPERSIL